MAVAGWKTLVMAAPFAALMGCAELAGKDAPPEMPTTRWDFRPEATIWTTHTMAALEDHGARLPDIVPADIATWCPAYPKAEEDERAAFWTGMLSALAKHESSHNPAASGGGGRWIGLMQIAPDTARAYGCEATSTAALKNGSANLECAVRIAAVQVGRDGMVAGNGTRGLGRDWAPFRNASKRAEMAAWTRSQSYCQG